MAEEPAQGLTHVYATQVCIEHVYARGRAQRGRWGIERARVWTAVGDLCVSDGGFFLVEFMAL